jgi:hypothetical protein
MRWPSGPLEIATRRKNEGFSAQARQTLEHWHTPPALDILQGSPINCLVVAWASGLAEDAEQQKTIRPLLDAARSKMLDVVGWVDGPADPKAAIASAKAAGLSAVALKGFTGKADLPVIPWADRAHAPWDATAEVFAVTDNVWPGVAGRTGTVSAGPTRIPWLDSNGWFVKLARARAKAPVWMCFDPPNNGQVVPARSYPTAVCDVEVAGGRWIVSLDDALRADLAAKKNPALAAWKSVGETISFFDRHREWKSYRSLGVLGVVSDFAGDNFEFAGELLNLSARRDLQFRVLWNLGKGALDLAGLKAVTWTDAARPAPELRRGLMSFVEQGGLLITGPKWGTEGRSVPNAHPSFDIRTLGKGRLAVAKEEPGDPWVFVNHTAELLSHANDVAKLFNAGASGGINLAGSPDGKRAVFQILSYASYGRQTTMATAWTRRKFTSARVWTVEAAQATTVAPALCEDGGTEYPLPPIPPYSALELEV